MADSSKNSWPTREGPDVFTFDGGSSYKFPPPSGGSAKKYSCDEFPAASWIEGGDGPGGAANAPGDQGGTEGNTYCATPCSPTFGRIGSEQDWQGTSHSMLRRRLTAGLPPNREDALRFRLRLINDIDVGPARIWFTDANGQPDHSDLARPPKRLKRQETAEVFASGLILSTEDYLSMGYVSDEVIVLSNNGTKVRFADEGIISVEELEAKVAAEDATDESLSPATQLTNGTLPTTSSGTLSSATPSSSTTRVEKWNETYAGTDSWNTTTEDVQPWNVTAAEVDESLTEYSFKTHQQPTSDKVDILNIGTNYILGQISSPNSTANFTSLRRRADGPIQCGPDSPCVDGSCCNSDGKCGFKEANCGASCISNCDAKAMCGIDSADGKTACGAQALLLLLRLQGYGSCELKSAPQCGTGSGTSNGRRAGYYQGWNTHERACDKVRPRQINTRGLTHLFYSFAFFHPTTFEMMPMHEGDIPLYGEFTALKRNGLQTWIAIGVVTFSDMVSTAANRAAFISSLLEFMETYGFQGADIDWEYPSEPKRGGRADDAANLVLLMKKMRAAFSPRGYGSSIALAPDYWYLRGFRPFEMQQYVDFMGFMSYDLHGPWDTDVKALGSIVRPQTDITKIKKNLMPLWYDGVDPAKVNLGLAFYGRTGNSWVGYDDEETYALKRAVANDLCIGGTMIWSIDFDAETGGGGAENEYASPESATIIPMAHTTVAPGATFTLGQGAATDVVKLPKGGDQNTPSGPGPDNCGSRGFFRLITSTCCGVGGSVGNPIEIPAGVPVPMDIPLPGGFVPNQPFTDADGKTIPANQPLPKETILPRGTSFPSPFLIEPDQPLRVGENDDTVGNGSVIWLSPGIWDNDRPDVSCYPPCTLLLPPWLNNTFTIDYPLITSTDTVRHRTTTITFPPITETRRPIQPIIPETTTTWPVVTWYDDDGQHTTRPPVPPPPPPPLAIPIPEITIKVGPPFPTVRPCAFPGPGCPAPTPVPGDDGYIPGEGDPSEEEGDPDKTCLLQNPVNCYNTGMWSLQEPMIKAIERFYGSLRGQTLAAGDYREKLEDLTLSSQQIGGTGNPRLVSSIDVKPGCKWAVNETSCRAELRKPVDQRNAGSANRKMGGDMFNNCLVWRIDTSYE
ncbi:carbohydrate-binding module family 18 protein [Colletotrichum musicola]|uniref:chitinase n=1 Tax=Colletotrichum musicola TaxID=2175873 RepID=A0A8H6K356_9PEZI|nr:carbohydrate-binding module family 18 protein [Colletotrichum musicola]